MQVKCNKCGYIGDWDEFPKGHDFTQVVYVKACANPEGCDNKQNPGDASMRMFPGSVHPFVFVRDKPDFKTDITSEAFLQTMWDAGEAS